MDDVAGGGPEDESALVEGRDGDGADDAGSSVLPRELAYGFLYEI